MAELNPSSTRPHDSRLARRRSLAGPVLLLMTLASLASCRTPPTQEDHSGKARMIGVIEMVRPIDRFVLIKGVTAVTEEPGTEIITYARSGGETARLRLSPQRRRMMLTADILSGDPSIGDYAVIPGTDGKEWVPQALPPVMLDDGTPSVPELSPDIDSLPDLQPPPGVDRLAPGTIPELTPPPGVEPGELTDLGPLDLPPPPPHDTHDDLLP